MLVFERAVKRSAVCNQDSLLVGVQSHVSVFSRHHWRVEPSVTICSSVDVVSPARASDGDFGVLFCEEESSGGKCQGGGRVSAAEDDEGFIAILWHRHSFDIKRSRWRKPEPRNTAVFEVDGGMRGCTQVVAGSRTAFGARGNQRQWAAAIKVMQRCEPSR